MLSRILTTEIIKTNMLLIIPNVFKMYDTLMFKKCLITTLNNSYNRLISKVNGFNQGTHGHSSVLSQICDPRGTFRETTLPCSLPRNIYVKGNDNEFTTSSMIKYSNAPNVMQNPTSFVISWTYFAKTEEPVKGGPVRQSGGGLGRLDATGEAGFFHKTNKSRLEEIKKKLKDKPKDDPTTPTKTDK